MNIFPAVQIRFETNRGEHKIFLSKCKVLGGFRVDIVLHTR